MEYASTITSGTLSEYQLTNQVSTCSSYCQSRQACNFFSYNYDTRRCELYTDVTTYGYDSKSITATKKCMGAALVNNGELVM